MSGELYEVYGKIQYSPKAQCPVELYGTSVKLKSKEGDTFELEAEAACMSKVIKSNLVTNGVGEEISIPMKKTTVTKVVEYMKYHVTNPFGGIRTPLESENLVECGATKWDSAFVTVDKDMIMELAIAASILDIPSLFFLTGAKLAVMTKDKPADKLIKDFALALDMDPDEEENVKQKVQEATKAKWGEGYDDSLTAIACILSSMSIAAEKSGLSMPEAESGVASGVKSYRKSGWRAAVFQSWRLLADAPDEARSDRELIAGVLAASSGAALGYASGDLKADRALVLEAVKYGGAVLKDADVRLQSDRGFVREAVAVNPAALGGASEDLRSSRSFLMELAREGLGRALQGASDPLRSDKEFILEMTAEDADSFKGASDDLKNDRSFALQAVQKSGKALQYLPLFSADKEIVLAAVASSPDAIPFVHTSRRAELGLNLPYDSEVKLGEEADQQAKLGVEGGTKMTPGPMWTSQTREDYCNYHVKMQKMLYFSGMGTITPNIGQVNYLAANSLHDRLPIYNRPELDVVTLLQGAVGGTVGMRWKAFASADQLANASPESMLGIIDECRILEVLAAKWDPPEVVAGAFIDEQSRQWILSPQAGVIQGPPWGSENIAVPVQRSSAKLPEPVQPQQPKPAPEAGPLGGWPALLDGERVFSAPPAKEKPKELEPFEGAHVQLVGLAAGNKLNFKEGCVLKQFKDGKWKIRMDEKKLGHVLVTSDRMRVLPPDTPMADATSPAEIVAAQEEEEEAARNAEAQREAAAAAAAAAEREAAVAAAREAAERRRERVAEKRLLVKEKILTKRSQVQEAGAAEDNSDDEPPPLEDWLRQRRMRQEAEAGRLEQDREYAEDEAVMLAGATAPFTAPFAGPRF